MTSCTYIIIINQCWRCFQPAAWLKLNPTKQLVQKGFLLDYIKKWHIQWPHYLPLFFSHRLIKARIGNQQTSHQSIKKETKQISLLFHLFTPSHLSNYNILSANQHGFRTGQSCDTQLLGAINDFHHGIDTGSHIDAFFLDFSKALDKVSHRKLCHKLSCYGVNGNLLCWIKDYLTDCSQCVLPEGVSSKSHHVLSGVPQGLVLGPLLFLIYINDITESITSTIRLYADDVLIYSILKLISSLYLNH